MKDTDNCKNGRFAIALYSWQDLADLIEENRNTYNWYVNSIQFKQQFEIEVLLDTGHETNVIRPQFLKKTISYEYGGQWTGAAWSKKYTPLFGSDEINKTWCELKLTIVNSGSVVLEDLKFKVQFPAEVQDVDDDFTKDILLVQKLNQYRTTWANKEAKHILYKPLENAPLIQKDKRSFNCFCKPSSDKMTLNIKWQLLARDFDREGNFDIIVEPEIIEQAERVNVFRKEHEKTEIEISDIKREENNLKLNLFYYS
jgi:hypothetical protein